MDVDAAVLPPLFLDFSNPDLPDFAGRGQVGTATGLEIHALHMSHAIQPSTIGHIWTPPFPFCKGLGRERERCTDIYLASGENSNQNLRRAI